jgi:CO dehydrogenase/acetyl-CoA synthase gamma subunit (corrinoid Fe-S protein)
MNLTTITDYEEVQIKHFLDSLTVTLALKQPAVSDSLRIIDVGTGAGLPGIPLKIMFPNIRLVLLEATAKKVAQLTDKPLILCALEPAVMEQGLAAVGDKRPLIYAATKNNWKEMADLALMYKCPLVASSPQDLDTLKSLAKTLT